MASPLSAGNIMIRCNKMASANCLVWAIAIITVMIKACKATATNDTSRDLSYTQCDPLDPRRPSGAILKIYITCQRTPFGPNGLKLPVYEKSIYVSGKVMPVVFRSLGRLNKKAEDAISKMFHGVFRKQSSSADRGRGRIHHDNDLCCPTDSHLVQAPERATNIHGEEFDIVFLRGLDESRKYQFYQAGECLPPGYLTGCDGTCVQMMSTVYLMVFSPHPEELFGFEPFEVPAYCSCQNIGSSLARNSGLGENTTNSTEVAIKGSGLTSGARGTFSANGTMSNTLNQTKSGLYKASIPDASNGTANLLAFVANATISVVPNSTVPVASNNTIPGESSSQKIGTSNRRRPGGSRITISETSHRIIPVVSNRTISDRFYRKMKGVKAAGPPAISNISDLAEGKISGLLNNSTSDLVNNSTQDSHHDTEK